MRSIGHSDTATDRVPFSVCNFGKLWRVLPFLIVGGLLWMIYFHLGTQLAARDLLRNDVFFHSDTRRVAHDIAEWGEQHRRTNVHPIFVLLINFIGVALAKLTDTPLNAALLLNSFAGALSVSFSGWFLLSAGITLRRALLFSMILGCSAAHLFFGSAPETYSFSALSIVLLFYLTLKRPGRLWPFVAAGVFSFGILITNLATATVAFGTPLLPDFDRLKLWRIVRFVAIVVALTMALATVQKVIWPQTQLFFIPSSYIGESRFMSSPDKPIRLGRRELLLLRYVFGFDWFAPTFHSRDSDKRGSTVGFEASSFARLPTSGRIGISLWLTLVAATGYSLGRFKLYRRPLPLGLLLALLCNFALHTFYGDDLFLYSCNTCFLVAALIALCTAELPLSPLQNKLADFGLLILLVCEIANNERFMTGIMATLPKVRPLAP